MTLINRFNDIHADDAVTVIPFRHAGHIRAKVIGPARIMMGADTRETLLNVTWLGDDRNLDVVNALEIARSLSERHGVPLGVFDPDSLWDTRWGRLE